jgi:hypothetical protein
MTRILSLAAATFVLCHGAFAADGSRLRPWTNYHAIMWIGDSAYKRPEKIPLFFQRLREMGIDTGMVSGDANPRTLLDNNFPYYVENMVNRGLCLKWNSKVRDWDKFVTQWRKDGSPDSALVRDYCLDDPQWRAWAKQQMQSIARKNAPHAPLGYDIRDELSTTISANPFDYDFSPLALAKFREWLKGQYKDLAALNAGWETKFASWDEVRPFTTDQIKNRMASGDAIPRGKPDWQAVQRVKLDPASAEKNRTRWNFSPWCDFRTYMDISLAGTLNDLRLAAREIDPQTPVGIEGTQMPHAFGGYDLWRLSQVLDWIEPYDIGNSREIFGSFMPGKTFVTTVFEKDTPHASRRLWHLLLEGDRGAIVWWSEDCIDWKSDDYALTPKAKALAPVFQELKSPVAQLFLRAQPERDPIFLLYSQPSIQVNWLLESTVDGSTWLRRFSSYESSHNVAAKKRNGWLKLFQDLGYSPQFLAADTLSFTFNPQVPGAVMVLSEARALSHPQAHAVAMLLDRPPGSTGNVIFSDTPPAMFNEHGRFIGATNPLARLGSNAPVTVGKVEPVPGKGIRFSAVTGTRDIAAFHRQRVAGKADDWYAWAQQFVSLPRPVTVPAETHTRIHRYTFGHARLLAFERNIDWHMSEDLKQSGGNEPLEKPAEITATLAQPAHVYDLRTEKYLGRTGRITFTLDPWKPSLFALLPEKAGGPVIAELQQAGR